MSTAKRILIVEDEADLADLLAYNLRRAGHETEVARDGRSGLAKVRELQPDLVVLDVMLPQMSGLDVAREVRTDPRIALTPIIMLTARTGESDQIGGLAAGADDYIAKPFSVKVLLARIEALLRRTKAGAGGAEGAGGMGALSMGAVEVDLSTHEVRVGGELVKLTLTEFRLLVALMRAGGKTLSRYDLMERAMGPGVMVTTRTIDVHIASLRKKLGAAAEGAGGMIRTVRGVGYRMTEEAGGAGGELEPAAGEDEAAG